MLVGIGLLATPVLLWRPLKAATTGMPVIVQTNSAGDSVTLIDPATDKVIGEIPGIEVGSRCRSITRWHPALLDQRVT